MNQTFLELSDNFSKLLSPCEESVGPKNGSIRVEIRIFSP